ncbi:uroporphyrinogen-III C-methyltransferase [Advenella sp. FME57]|uniref:uroporphyrinogen-III C-methyltransferase n=1 Tax=Advenella sp. FME57 TaxID=2742604 RepID=UPI0018660E2B|nr:uroporphyrinogen-III C-methyltransferase [Advenella sp. FME57]
MEKKQDDARNTENEKKPEAAGHHAQQGSAAPDTVTDAELAKENTTAEKTAAHVGKADTTAGEKPVSGAAGGAIPPLETGKNDSNAGKGTKGPLIAALVVVAAIAAGGYYYAQNNQSELESGSQTSSESDSSTPAEAPTSGAAQPDQTPAADATSDSSDSSQSDAAGNAESAQSADTTPVTTSGDAQVDADVAGEGASPGDSATTAQDEASGSNSSTPMGPTASNSEPTQPGAEAAGNSTAQSSSTVTTENTSSDASVDATDTAGASEQDTATTPTSAAGTPATAVDAPHASGAPSAAGSGTGGFTGSLPADIRDQLDRQSAQIIALRDQLESSQKQLQQLQTTRLQASRDETTLFVVNDVSRLVTMAQNELAIAGNLENALASLETAIKAIDQADAPVLAGLRGALAADIVTLKSAPAIGVDAQFTQVAALSEKIDALPMLAPDQAGAKPMAGQPSEVTSPAGGANDTNAVASSDVWYERAWNEVKTWPVAAWEGLRSDLGGIVRVEKLADPNQMLLTVDQAAQLRTNLKQHLHFAQQALLNRQQGIWTSSLETVVNGVRQSFNQDSVETQQVLGQLQQLLKAGVRQQLPPITQSVKAVQETRKQLKSMNPGQE